MLNNEDVKCISQTNGIMARIIYAAAIRRRNSIVVGLKEIRNDPYFESENWISPWTKLLTLGFTVEFLNPEELKISWE